MMSFHKKIRAYKRHQAIKYLSTTPSATLSQAGMKKLVPAFRKAAQEFPAYKDLLQKNNAKPDKVRTAEDFSKVVPLTTKENYFSRYSYPDLLGKNTKRMKLAMSSSGFSGTYAYGFNSGTAISKGSFGVDLTLDYWFDITNKTTFLINCAPMGVHVETSLPLAEVSVRSDMAISLVKKVSPSYDQTILIGDPYFIKKLIEEGCKAGIDWKKLNVSVITAQDWLPESLRTYLSTLLEFDADTEKQRGIFATMGMTELGLNVFHETRKTIALRRTILKDPDLRNQLLNTEMKAPPCFFHYYPFRTFIESIAADGIDELIFTSVDKDAILPIIRYRTGDRGTIVSHNQLEEILSANYPELIPDLKLPIGIMCGRASNVKQVQGKMLYVEDVKESLYLKPEIASLVTGLTGIRIHNNTPEIVVHLAKGVNPDRKITDFLQNTIGDYLGVEANVKPVSYYELHDVIDLNYERKLFLPV